MAIAWPLQNSHPASDPYIEPVCSVSTVETTSRQLVMLMQIPAFIAGDAIIDDLARLVEAAASHLNPTI